jgi:hypothetical protein
VEQKKKKFNPDTLEKYKFEISRELGIVDATNLEAPDKFKDNARSHGRNGFFDGVSPKS